MGNKQVRLWFVFSLGMFGLGIGSSFSAQPVQTLLDSIVARTSASLQHQDQDCITLPAAAWMQGDVEANRVLASPI